MLSAFGKRALILSLLLAVALGFGFGCGDGNGAKPSVPAGDGTPVSLPEDFPLYPGLKLGTHFTIAENLVVQASSGDAVDEIVAYYTEELQKGRWELVTTEMDEAQTTLFFSAEGFPSNGRVAMAEDKENPGKTIVGISMPVAALGEGAQ